MKKVITKSTEWYLLKTDCPEALKDTNLTMSDRNVLSVLLMLGNTLKEHNKDGSTFFRTDEKLLQDLEDSQCPLSDRQLQRIRLKLSKLGYIKYKSGHHNNRTGRGSATMYWVGDDMHRFEEATSAVSNVAPNTNTNTKTKTKSNTNSNNRGDIEDESEEDRRQKLQVLEIRRQIDEGIFKTESMLQQRLLFSSLGGYSDILMDYWHTKRK